MTPPHVFKFHEYGAVRHMLAVTHLADQGEIGFDYVIGQVLRRGLGALVRGQTHKLPDVIDDAASMARLLVAPPSTVIVGVAPYSAYVYYLELLKRRHRVIYNSSWPHWGPGGGVHHPENTSLRAAWLRWLDGLEAVGVTRAVCDGLEEHGARVHHIPHCVDTDFFSPPKTPRNTSTVEVLFCGRMVEHKGIGLLMECVKRMTDLDVRWTFLGEGPMRAPLLDMA